MKTNKGVRFAHIFEIGNSFFISLKKEMGSLKPTIFFSANPACSLRFPIAATQAKLILI
jgi:hypothetical protein